VGRKGLAEGEECRKKPELVRFQVIALVLGLVLLIGEANVVTSKRPSMVGRVEGVARREDSPY
jgi:hypothetical protein